MAPFTAQFSASVAWRTQVVMKTWVGSMPASEARSASGSSRSAAIGPHAGDAGLRLAGDAVDLPALGDEVRGQIVPDDAGHAGDECSRCHEWPFRSERVLVPVCRWAVYRWLVERRRASTTSFGSAHPVDGV